MKSHGEVTHGTTVGKAYSEVKYIFKRKTFMCKNYAKLL